MDIPIPRDWTEELVTPQMMNTEIRDALNFILNPPAVAAELTSPQTIPDTAWTTIQFDQITRDSDGISDPLNEGVYTIGTAGLYLCGVNAIFASDTSGTRHAAVYLNDVNVGRVSRNAISSGVAGGLSLTKSLVLIPGDVIKFKVHQNTGSGHAINGSGDEISSAFIQWISK